MAVPSTEVKPHIAPATPKLSPSSALGTKVKIEPLDDDELAKIKVESVDEDDDVPMADAPAAVPSVLLADVVPAPATPSARKPRLVLTVRKPRLVLKVRAPIILSLTAPLARLRAAKKITPVTVIHEFTFGAPVPVRCGGTNAPLVRAGARTLFLRKPRYKQLVRAVRHHHQVVAAEGGIPAGPPKFAAALVVPRIEMPDGSRMPLTQATWEKTAEQALMRPVQGQEKARIVLVSRAL
ncbi:hypothetical protein B0A55_02801 [Friedmanniomyces simplex]|uniref:Uncharacterized protein n=1 Tax=Friedmanniomyces simplex TaxID=329884 RepID=A0A4U0XXG9_9PEZI|nr:hypothetical protein B0A55_02801 [Friedmanniomyces simplex]